MLQFEFNNGKDGEKDNQSEPDASQNLAPSYIVSTTKVPSNWCHVIASLGLIKINYILKIVQVYFFAFFDKDMTMSFS